MDGNRRFAKKSGLSDIESKTLGFNKMLEIIKYCRLLGIKESSFFAFSLTNFKRKQSEVNNIMDLIKTKKRKLQEINVKVNIFGRKDVLDNEINSIFEEITSFYNDTEFVVNIFFAYSSIDEIENVSYKKEVDLLIRTSGEKRLSDFLLYQCANGTRLFFCESLWPCFSLLQLWMIIYKCEIERKYFGVNK